MDLRLTAATPRDALNEVADFYGREAGRLYARADLTTGRDRKDLEAQARYAGRQEQLWRGIIIEEPSQ